MIFLKVYSLYLIFKLMKMIYKNYMNRFASKLINISYFSDHIFLQFIDKIKFLKHTNKQTISFVQIFLNILHQTFHFAVDSFEPTGVLSTVAIFMSFVYKGFYYFFLSFRSNTYLSTLFQYKSGKYWPKYNPIAPPTNRLKTFLIVEDLAFPVNLFIIVLSTIIINIDKFINYLQNNIQYIKFQYKMGMINH
jgi:hypothetical protein